MSGVFFGLSYLTSFLLFEVTSLSAFMIGMLLLATEIEPRVKLLPATEGMLGPLMTVVALAKSMGFEGKALYEPLKNGVQMKFHSASASFSTFSMPAVGQGLFDEYQKELGDVHKKGAEFVGYWLPKVVVDGLGLSEKAEIRFNGDTIETITKKPFVRNLCVQQFMTENVCGKFGCPLVSSYGEMFADALNEPVLHDGCVYDPKTQTATTHHIRKPIEGGQN
jgi:hypothetical protein